MIFSAVSSRFIKFLIVDSLEENVIETSYQVAQTLVHELEKGQKIIFCRHWSCRRKNQRITCIF